MLCETCGHRFADASALTRHQRVHCAASSPFKCKTCGEAFARKNQLRNHRRVHNAHRAPAATLPDVRDDSDSAAFLSTGHAAAPRASASHPPVHGMQDRAAGQPAPASLASVAMSFPYIAGADAPYPTPLSALLFGVPAHPQDLGLRGGPGGHHSGPEYAPFADGSLFQASLPNLEDAIALSHFGDMTGLSAEGEDCTGTSASCPLQQHRPPLRLGKQQFFIVV
jgi:hypothetical protein